MARTTTQPRATIIDVAKHAGVSASTVSLVLRGRKGQVPLNPETVDRIVSSAAALNYRPNRHAQGLRSKRSGLRSIGVLARRRSVFAPVDSVVLASICETANKASFSCNVALIDPSDTVGLIDHPILREKTVEGIVALGWEHHELSEVEHFILQRIPLVTVHAKADSDDPVIGSVMTEDFEGGRIAGEHLANLGHRRVACIGGPETSIPTTLRIEGLRSVMERCGGTVLVVHDDYYDPDPPAIEPIMRSPKRPTGILACSDMLASVLLLWLPLWGFSVPRDVSVVGFDDQRMARNLRPPLTTVRQDPVGEGQAAAEMVIGMIRGEPVADRRVVMMPELVVRESTGMARGE